MKTTFKLRNKTNRQSGCTLIIDPVRHALGWDVVRQYDCDEGTRLAGSELVISYDVPTLVQQFSLTSKRAKKLSDLFDSML
jgi:hypothetical protein